MPVAEHHRSGESREAKYKIIEARPLHRDGRDSKERECRDKIWRAVSRQRVEEASRLFEGSVFGHRLVHVSRSSRDPIIGRNEVEQRRLLTLSSIARSWIAFDPNLSREADHGPGHVTPHIQTSEGYICISSKSTLALIIFYLVTRLDSSYLSSPASVTRSPVDYRLFLRSWTLIAHSAQDVKMGSRRLAEGSDEFLLDPS